MMHQPLYTVGQRCTQPCIVNAHSRAWLPGCVLKMAAWQGFACGGFFTDTSCNTRVKATFIITHLLWRITVSVPSRNLNQRWLWSVLVSLGDTGFIRYNQMLWTWYWISVNCCWLFRSCWSTESLFDLRYIVGRAYTQQNSLSHTAQSRAWYNACTPPGRCDTHSRAYILWSTLRQTLRRSETYFRQDLFPSYLFSWRQFHAIVIFRLKSISDLDSGSLPRFFGEFIYMKFKIVVS